MFSRLLLVSAALVASVADVRVRAETAQSFTPAATAPSAQSTNYVGTNNQTLTSTPVVTGQVFDRFIQIWIENTDYATAASSHVFRRLAERGLLLKDYNAVTHPSQPNYLASVGGDFWGLGDDDYYHIPSNISTIVDLLEAKGISWAEYLENEPTDGFTGYNYTSTNYQDSTKPGYTYYERKHSPLSSYDSVMNVPSRTALLRNFNDFAADLGNGTLPQWMFVTPNMVDDGHDTTIDYAGAWLRSWLVPLLDDKRFNNDRTLIIITFDETETYTEENVVYTLLLGGALPDDLKNTTDHTFYTHYSCLSTVEANWNLGSLGRQDTNQTMSNVFSFVADVTGYNNHHPHPRPSTNLTGTIPGPLNSGAFIPFTAPNTSAVGAGGGSVFTAAQGLDLTITPANLPAPVNLTSSGLFTPWTNRTAMGEPTTTSATQPTQTKKAGAMAVAAGSMGAGAVAVVALGMLLL